MSVQAAPTSPPANRLLCVAASAGIVAAVKLHIARGDDLEGRDKNGWTALMIAASKGRTAVCVLLLQAGADPLAMDVSGKTAERIAIDASFSETAEVIGEAIKDRTGLAMSAALQTEHSLPNQNCGLELGSFELLPDFRHAPTPLGRRASREGALGRRSNAQETERSKETPNPPASAMAPTSFTAEVGNLAGEQDSEPFESLFGDWEAVTETVAPRHDEALASMELERQRRIAEHEPIDRSATWNDFDVDLPEFAKPLPRADDVGFKSELRRILLLAAREGSTPRLAMENLLSSRGDGDERDEEAEARLEFVVGALGAEFDERQEFTLGRESFAVQVDPVESPDEERRVDEALAMFEALASGSNDPLRIFLKSVNQIPLLTRESEATLARSMEDAVDEALVSLARWDNGLRHVLTAMTAGENDPIQLSIILATTRETALVIDQTEDSDASGPTSEGADADLDGIETEEAHALTSASAQSLDEALRTLTLLRSLAEQQASASNASQIATQLRALPFRRAFLARLADWSSTDKSAEASNYRLAIQRLLASRDEMISANLRLVHKIARKYFYSGVPVEDLIQEGNIGLMKAVDRFDWRRGLKFSTMATWWIKQQVGRSIADAGFAIRPPVHVYEQASKLRQAAEAFEREHGRCPSGEERAKMIGLSVGKMETIARPISEPMTIEDAIEEGRVKADEYADPMEEVNTTEVAREISTRLTALGRKPEAIVRMRHGVAVNDVFTLEEIGAAFEVTRERIRQIEAKAMRKLSAHHVREELAVALGWPPPKRPEDSKPKREEVDYEALEHHPPLGSK